MKKKLPKLKTDKAAEEFVAHSDLTEYDCIHHAQGAIRDSA